MPNFSQYINNLKTKSKLCKTIRINKRSHDKEINMAKKLSKDMEKSRLSTNRKDR